MKTYSFNSIYSQARDLYGLELPTEEFESIGLIAWDKIGNKQHKLYKYQTGQNVNSLGEYYIDMPCNCDYIEAVTADYEDYQKTTPTTISSNNQSGWIEDYIENRKYNTGNLYTSGKFIKYREERNRLYFSDKFDKVNVLYKGIIADDDGLPYVDVKEMDAIAAFLSYSDLFKRALMTRDQSTFQMAQVMEQKWKMMCTQARVPDYMNQNELDEILNVSASWDRKRFGKSFKPIR